MIARDTLRRREQIKKAEAEAAALRVEATRLDVAALRTEVEALVAEAKRQSNAADLAALTASHHRCVTKADTERVAVLRSRGQALAALAATRMREAAVLEKKADSARKDATSFRAEAVRLRGGECSGVAEQERSAWVRVEAAMRKERARILALAAYLREEETRVTLGAGLFRVGNTHTNACEIPTAVRGVFAPSSPPTRRASQLLNASVDDRILVLKTGAVLRDEDALEPGRVAEVLRGEATRLAAEARAALTTSVEPSPNAIRAALACEADSRSCKARAAKCAADARSIRARIERLLADSHQYRSEARDPATTVGLERARQLDAEAAALRSRLRGCEGPDASRLRELVGSMETEAASLRKVVMQPKTDALRQAEGLDANGLRERARHLEAMVTTLRANLDLAERAPGRDSSDREPCGDAGPPTRLVPPMVPIADGGDQLDTCGQCGAFVRRTRLARHMSERCEGRDGKLGPTASAGKSVVPKVVPAPPIALRKQSGSAGPRKLGRRVVAALAAAKAMPGISTGAQSPAPRVASTPPSAASTRQASERSGVGDDLRDAKRGWGHSFRDQKGQFGSYPVHDAHDDESGSD